MAITPVPISSLGAAAALDGSELVPVVQGGVTVQTTTQDIADLGGGSDLLALTLTAAAAIAAGTTNDLGTNITNANRLLLTPAGDAVLTGMAGGAEGQILVFQNLSAVFSITLTTEDVGSAAGNRFVNNGDTFIPPRGSAAFMRDLANVNRWVKI